MITLFTTPKAFEGHIGIIQENAIKSWMNLDKNIEIILVGNDYGVQEFSKKLGLKHIPLSQKETEKKPPLLKEIFESAARQATYKNLGFVNSDIILFQDFLIAWKKTAAAFKNYLMISSRYNMDITSILDMNDPKILSDLRQKARLQKDMYPAGGSDFFVFPKSLFPSVPPFLLGRGYWDNWLMYQASKNGAAIVDTTYDVVAVHENHDYSHVKEIKNPEKTAEIVFSSNEGKHNLKLAGGLKTLYTNYDADYILKNGKFYSSLRPFFLYRLLKTKIRRQFMKVRNAECNTENK